jgi:hypothetical protein
MFRCLEHGVGVEAVGPALQVARDLAARMRRRSVLLDIDVDKERGCVHRVDGVVDRVEVALRLGIVDVGAGDGAGLDERLDLADGEQQVGSAVVVVVVAPTSMSTVAPRRSTSSWR